MKEEHKSSKEKETQLAEEIERLKKKMSTQTSHSNLRQNKGEYLEKRPYEIFFKQLKKNFTKKNLKFKNLTS